MHCNCFSIHLDNSIYDISSTWFEGDGASRAKPRPNMRFPFRHKTYLVMTGDAWFQTLGSWVKVLWVALHSNPDLHLSRHFLALESKSYYVICSSHVKVTLTPLQCRFNRNLWIFDKLGMRNGLQLDTVMLTLPPT